MKSVISAMLCWDLGKKKVTGVFASLLTKRRDRNRAYELYSQLVRQARNPVFYTQHKVADTIEGRFDLILLHLFLVDKYLSTMGKEFVQLRRYIQEAMVSDMDRSFREMGVGDMSVGKEMKKVGAAWLGRKKAYEAGFAEDAGTDSLEQALERNLFADLDDPQQYTASVANYTREADSILTEQPLETTIASGLLFPDPATF